MLGVQPVTPDDPASVSVMKFLAVLQTNENTRHSFKDISHSFLLTSASEIADLPQRERWLIWQPAFLRACGKRVLEVGLNGCPSTVTNAQFESHDVRLEDSPRGIVLNGIPVEVVDVMDRLEPNGLQTLDRLEAIARYISEAYEPKTS